MKNQFQKIGVIGKTDDPRLAETLQHLRRHLGHHGIRMFLEEETGSALGDETADLLPLADLGQGCDLAIIIGGDGTLLLAARGLASARIPMLGINLGRLGFLVDISPGELEDQMDAILGGEFIEEERTLLHCAVHRDGKLIHESDALNDVVLQKSNVARMIEFETYVDGRFLNTQRSDGLIVSTPTGSTAYALSGGGPIVQPGLNATVLVPICPHTLSNRPIVVAGDSLVEISICETEGELTARLTCDGQPGIEVTDEDRITVSKKAHGILVLHPLGHDYFEVLRAKLGWGGHH